MLSDSPAALAVLREADARYPHEIDILVALVSINREAGNARAALLEWG